MTRVDPVTHAQAINAAHAEYADALVRLDEVVTLHTEAVERCERALAQIRYLARRAAQ